MVEKTQKIDMKKFIEDMADKFGLKVVNKDVVEVELKLPSNISKYDDLNSRDLALELKELDAEIKRIEDIDENIRVEVSKFMAERGPDKFTKRLFEGRNLDPRKLSVNDVDYTLKTNLRIYLERLFQQKLESELTDNFLKSRTELKGIVTNIEIKPTPTGEMLHVHVGKEEKPKDLPVEKPEEKKGVTTTDSVSTK